jgi:hypothetical protein
MDMNKTVDAQKALDWINKGGIAIDHMPYDIEETIRAALQTAAASEVGEQDPMLLRVLNFIELAKSLSVTTGYGVLADSNVERVTLRDEAAKLYAELDAIKWGVMPPQPAVTLTGEEEVGVDDPLEIFDAGFDRATNKQKTVIYAFDIRERDIIRRSLTRTERPAEVNAPPLGGWTLVPVEPTYQMAEAMGVKWEAGEGFPTRYKAMLSSVAEQSAQEKPNPLAGTPDSLAE